MRICERCRNESPVLLDAELWITLLWDKPTLWSTYKLCPSCKEQWDERNK